jgi:ribonuclease P protein component
MQHTVTLNKNGDFKRMYARAKSQVHPALVTYAMKNRRGTARIGITASKKIGTAVMRNRARRVIREAYRALEPDIPAAYDLVFVARGKTPYKKSTEIKRVMAAQLRALGILP